MVSIPIPVYPGARPIEVTDRGMLQPILWRLRPRVSELTFANLFLFRAAHRYRLTLVGDSTVVIGQGYKGEPYFLPPLNGDRHGACDALLDAGMVLYGADASFLAELPPKPTLTVAEDRDNADYLYRRRDLAELPGNRYHNKRNRINYFTSRHSFGIRPYEGGLSEGCLLLLDQWARVRGIRDGGSASAEVDATREALRLAEPLELEGLVVLVEGDVKAFVLGERLNEETSVCHFEKADPFMEGLSQLLDREFNLRLFTDCPFVNREQDLGETGLRDAKLSYHPLELVRKYRVQRSR